MTLQARALAPLLQAPGRLGGARPGALALLPAAGQVRWRRVNIQRPQRPSWFRQQLLAVAAPRLPEEPGVEAIADSCEMAERLEEEREWAEHINQLERFYVQEMVEQFESSEMIAFFHTNPIKEADWRRAWQVGVWRGARDGAT